MIEQLESFGTLRVMAMILSVHIVVTSAQFLSTKSRYEKGGILSWRVSKFYAQMSVVGRILEPVLRHPRFQLLLLLRLCCGLAIGALAVSGTVSPWLLAFILVTDIGIVLRHQSGLSGDNHIGLVLAAGLTIAAFSQPGSTLYVVALFFIAAHAILSYFIAGYLKLISPIWRSGDALPAIFSTRTWGHERAYRWVRGSPMLAVGGAWVVILFETAFPMVLLVDQRLVPVFLIGGVLFHLSNAIFMHLNGFLIAFPATYPALIYANETVTRWLSFSIGPLL